LADVELPTVLRRGAGRYRAGRAAMQIHLALSEPVRWRSPDLDRTAVVHLSDGSSSAAVACAQAAAGQLPARPTIGVGQPTTADPDRCPPGAGVLWLQLLEAPSVPTADAAGTIATPGGWTADVAEAFADRVLAQIS